MSFLLHNWTFVHSKRHRLIVLLIRLTQQQLLKMVAEINQTFLISKVKIRWGELGQ